MMKKLADLNLGFADAENYKRRENKELLNNVFVRNEYLDRLCEPAMSFLIGEKGTGKTVYSVFLANNDYKNTRGALRYIRETDYRKFLALKGERTLNLSDFSSIWKVIILLLLCGELREKEQPALLARMTSRFKAINDAIDEYYAAAFAPEITQALQFVEESKLSAELIAKHLKAAGEEKESATFSATRFQVNLLYIQRKFEAALAAFKPDSNHILFIDGIDIRPATIPFEEYKECVQGLANAVWELNNDFFPTIKGGKGRLRAVLLLRPDIFVNLGLQNQNTKIRDNSVYLDWRTEYANYRTSNLFHTTDHLLAWQQRLKMAPGDAWNLYFPWDTPGISSAYVSPTSFLNLLRYSYHRPRDIVTALRLMRDVAVKNNREKQFFVLEDFDNDAFQTQYSEYLLGEVKDHLVFYYSLKDYELFLKFFEFLQGAHAFTYKTYLSAFAMLERHINSIDAKPPQFTATPNDFLQFLYDSNVICYLEDPDEGGRPFLRWCFRERAYSNIAPKVKEGMRYEVFYGLAKALNVGKRLR
jgi:hypothetical protein